MLRRWLLVLLLLALPCLILYRNAIFFAETAVFRDAGHFYYPLFKWTAERWMQLRIPLWNPHENAGTPMLADASSSIFYPGKILFCLPLDFPRLYCWYIALHSFVACFFCYLWLRRCQVSVSGSIVASWTYAYGGTLLQLHSNIVFLVGAAWLPFALLAAIRICHRGRNGILGLSFALSMMVLGGDPQMAYMTCLVVASWAWWQRRSEPGTRFRLAISRVGLAAIWAIGLSSLQVLPSVEWSRQSERANFASPRSVYEIPTAISRGQTWGEIGRSLTGKPRDGHPEFSYDFSVPAWRWLDALLPNFFGKRYPVNHRWSFAWEMDSGIWTPSLFVGWIPFLLAIVYALDGSRGPERRWPCTVLIVSLLAAMGVWGIGYFINLASQWQGGEPIMGDPTGGVYWLMNVFLPGFAYFRYPAKLLVIAAIALSLMTARGWDRLSDEHFRKRLWYTSLLTFIPTIGLFRSAIQIAQSDAREQATDDVFGALDPTAVANELYLGFALTLAGALFVILCMRTMASRPGLSRCLLAAVTLISLMLGNGWIIATVPDKAWQPTKAMVSRGATKKQKRTYVPPQDPPKRWSIGTSADRCREVLKWELQYHVARLNLLSGTSVIDSENSIVSAEWLAVLDTARELHPGDDLPAWFLKLFGVVYTFETVKDDLIPKLLEATPRVWIASQTKRLEPLVSPGPTKLLDRTREVFVVSPGVARDLVTETIVECSAEVVLPDAHSGDSQLEVVRDFGSRVDLRAELSKSALLVMRDRFDHGWRAEVSTDGGPFRPVQILRTNRVMRGLVLPPGRHQIRMSYAPVSFLMGLWISTASWLIVLVCVGWRLRGDRIRKSRCQGPGTVDLIARPVEYV